jgi:hypothetical protein
MDLVSRVLSLTGSKKLMQIGNEILELSERPTMINLGDWVDPNDIKVNSTGRLVAKFLRTFFPDE